MNCDDAQLLINAQVDGQAVGDPALLDAHLAQCDGCRRALAALTRLDGQLREALAQGAQGSDAVTRATMARIRFDISAPAYARRRWLIPSLSAAAGFALAVLILRPWHSPPLPKQAAINVIVASRPAPPVARLTLATGTILVRGEGEQAWHALETGGSVAPGVEIRTGADVFAEFTLEDGSELRLCDRTQVKIELSRQWRLDSGRMWTGLVPSASPFHVAVAQASLDAPGSARFDVRTEADSAILTVLGGVLRVGETPVSAGQSLTVVGGRPGPVTSAGDLVIATRWLNEILVLKGRDNPELASRIDDLFAQIGQTKMEGMLESEIRALGDHCVLPLTRYLESDRSRGPAQAYRRAKAATILGDFAQPWSIPDLIGLLSHDDGQVRFHAARALGRLTSRSAPCRSEDWQTRKPAELAPCLDDWKAWWDANREKIPMAPTPR